MRMGLHSTPAQSLAIPPSLDARMARLRKLAWLIDGAFVLPLTRFRYGLNSLIGRAPATPSSP